MESPDDVVAPTRSFHLMASFLARAVEEKIHEINQATKNAIASLNTTLKTRLVRLPKALKMAPLDTLSAGAPGKAGVVSPPSASLGMEPPGRGGPEATATEHRGARGAGGTRSTRSTRSTRGKEVASVGVAEAPRNPAPAPGAPPESLPNAQPKPPPPLFQENESGPSPPPVQFSRAKKRAAHVDPSTDARPSMSYNGVPLQTPMPFAGMAVPMPVQLLTVQAQGKRAGGKTKASRNAPQAAVVTTKDGKQWAVGVNGLRDIPESHRYEVGEYLQSQFSFLQDALGAV